MLLLGVVGLAGTIAYSRFILGMHSLNQIVYGSLLGIWLAISFYFIIQERFITHATELVQDRVFHNRVLGKKFVSLALLAFVILSLMMTVEVTIYLLASTFFIPSDTWIVAITADCGADALTHAFMALSLVQTGQVAIGFGAYFGLLI